MARLRGRPDAAATWERIRAGGIAPVAALVGLGTALRLASYLANPTLATDEAALVLNVMHRSYGGLLDELDFNQGAPVGFLWIQKALFELLGSSEYVFRLLPLVAALAALALFYPVAVRFLGRSAALLALGLFAILEPLLFYSATAKQYSVDVAVGLGLYALALSVGRRVGRREAALLALAGGAAVWLSHAAVFVLAGIVTVLTLEAIVGRDRQRILSLTGVVGAWLVSFAIVYVVALRDLAGLQRTLARGRGFVAAEADGGLPRALASGARYLLGVTPNPDGVGLAEGVALVGIFLAAVGAVALLARRWAHALLLVAPAGFTLAASAVGAYPIFPRALLFLAPALVILVAAAVRWAAAHRARRVLAVAAAAGFLAVVSAAAVNSARHLDARGDEVKQILRHLAVEQQPGDSLYVFHTLQYTFRYYLECACFGSSDEVRSGLSLWPLEAAAGGVRQDDPALASVPPALIVGQRPSSVPEQYEPDFARLLGRERVWILLAGSRPVHLHALVRFADGVGRQRASFRPGGGPAGAYLYDLSGRS